jgi:LuxR family transcriptional activator of conjugal transfer of Ti plasmids
MLETLYPGSASMKHRLFVPPFLLPLVNCDARGEELLPVVQSITNSLGFDSFMYGASANSRPDHEGKSFVYTTLPTSWVMRYSQMAYIEVDPRISLTWDSAIPLVWDQHSIRTPGSSARNAFLVDAASFGICSGVCFTFHGPRASHVIIALNSGIAVADEIRQHAIARNLPDILMFGHYFHEIFMKSVIERGLAPKSAGKPLSRRECECLSLAAHGLTTEDIAHKLDIAVRTVQFHFDGIRSKLGAANRQEAVGLAVQAGLIRAD